MNNVIKIFEEVKNTSGKNDKQRIISENSNNELFKECLVFLLDSNVITGISSAKLSKKIVTLDQLDSVVLTTWSDVMEYLKENNTGRDIDVLRVQEFISSQPQEHREFYEQMVTKKYRLGCDSTTVNKAIPNLIRAFNVMLAQKYWDNIDFVKNKKFIITEKLDGNRLVSVYENNNVRFFTRQGKEMFGLDDIKSEILNNLQNGYVYDGEIILNNNNNLRSDELFRETMKVVRKDGIKTNLVFHIFDMIPVEDFFNGVCNLDCETRKNLLIGNINKNMEWVKDVPILYQGYDTNMIVKLLDEQIELYHEGVMINLSDAPYECKRSKQILKVKRMQTADVKCIKVIEGEGSNKGKLGAITFEFIHNDKIYTCNCGSGFCESDRIEFWNNPNKIIGKIIEISYFEISTNQKDNSYSMRFPVYKYLRPEKTEISMY